MVLSRLKQQGSTFGAQNSDRIGSVLEQRDSQVCRDILGRGRGVVLGTREEEENQ